MPEWISAWGTLGAFLVAIVALGVSLVDRRHNRQERAAADARDADRDRQIEIMTRSIESLAASASGRDQRDAALRAAREAARWKIRRVEQANNRVVYELVNNTDGTATGVTLAPDPTGTQAPQFGSLPKDLTLTPHGTTRFYLRKKLSTVEPTTIQIVWDGGADTLPITR